MRTPDGEKAIEEFQPGDLVLAASEHDPDGPVEPRPVLEVFTSYQNLWEVQVRGHRIRTTALHPFYVLGQGWTAACHLQPGDLLRSDDGQWLPVESVEDTGEEEPVYNLHIAEYHTYFVGARDWGFSIWAHNDCLIKSLTNMVSSGFTSAQQLINRLNGLAGANRWAFWHGIKYQAERTLQYFKDGLLEGIEVAVGGGRVDILLKKIGGVQWAIDTKNWTRWAQWSAQDQLKRAKELSLQVRRYLNDPKFPDLRVILEFKNSVPGGVIGTHISDLITEFGARFSAVPF